MAASVLSLLLAGGWLCYLWRPAIVVTNASGHPVAELEVHSHASVGAVTFFGVLEDGDRCRTTFDVSDLYVDAVSFRLRGQLVRAAVGGGATPMECVRIEILPGGAVRATHGSRSLVGW